MLLYICVCIFVFLLLCIQVNFEPVMDPAASFEGAGVHEGEVSSNVGFGRGWFLRDEVQTPRVGGLRTPRFCSTRVKAPPCELPTPQTASSVELSTLISELANQIGQSIATQLRGDSNVGGSMSAEGPRPEQRPTELNLSGMKLVMQSDVKEPPIFRGDGSDKYSVREWVEVVGVYLMKRDTPKHQQSQEILSKLMGRAKDVVRVTLRHNPTLDPIQTPDLIFDILKQHFGELSYSSMPMADFYNTKPLQREGVMEYWIRLNNAIDIADECLKRQGRSVEDPGREVSMMFIKYCPDPVLFNRLSIKAAEEWSTSEVQERIDSYQRELRTRTQGNPPASQRHVVSHALAAMPQEMETAQPVQVSPAPHVLSVLPAAAFGAAPVSVLMPQLSPTAAPFIPAQATAPGPQPPQVPIPHNPAPAPAAQLTQHSTFPPAAQPAPAVDVNGMCTLLSLLDRMMTQQNVQVAAQAPGPSRQFTPAPRLVRNCRVCGDTGHSTLMHCRRENLCLSCFAPGHWKNECNRRGQRQMGQAGASRDRPSEN